MFNDINYIQPFNLSNIKSEKIHFKGEKVGRQTCGVELDIYSHACSLQSP